MSREGLHIAWARLLLRAFSSAGVREVVMSPGSRSTPLVIAALGDDTLRTTVLVDERTAAFYALGQARITGRPTLLLCTSGTAGAHYYPAIIEASQAHVPLLALTADRPWELQDAAAPQTIDQLRLFGAHVRHFADLGLPDPSPGALRAVPRIAAQCVALSLGPTPGPVHLNARFRKPLEPVPSDDPEPWEPLWSSLMEHGAPAIIAPAATPDETAVTEIAERIRRAERGLIVCGPMPITAASARASILDLARRTGFPLLAESTSQIRSGGDRDGVADIAFFDTILKSRDFRAANAPDLVLSIGAPPTSSAYAELLAQHAPARIVIAPHGHNDPSSDASMLVHADPADLVRRLSDRLAPRAPSSPWTATWARAQAVAEDTALTMGHEPGLSSDKVVRTLVDAAPEGSILMVGNSTPVRDLDAFCPASARPLAVLHQRGASGIDGLVSGAAGARSVTADPVALLLGDLSLLHDIGGLAVLRKAPGPLPVVVINNGGGAIFERLPIARSVDRAIFERGFLTPEPFSIEHAAATFGVAYLRAETGEDLARALGEAYAAKAPILIEAVIPTVPRPVGSGPRSVAPPVGDGDGDGDGNGAKR
ncbi:MAG: 2-succinyl-5-enolpyruvyl-6-hydroxy-3-cyclohexene-1-carboxylic-acid synthase [Byssovorax sp.]